MGKKILENKPDIDKNIVFLAIWLHDIGKVVGNKKNDHAVNS